MSGFRCLVCHRDGRRLDLGDTAAPASAERRPGAQRSQETQPLVAKRRDQRLRRDGADGGQRGRADDAVTVRPGDALQAPRRPRNPRVHAVVEDRVVEPGRQVVASQRRPVVRAVNGLGVRERHGRDVRRRRTGLRVAPVVGYRDAEIGGAARIARIVGVAALVRKHARERGAVG